MGLENNPDKPLSTQTCHYCAVLMVDVLKGMESVTAAHIDQLYMLHTSRCRAQGYREYDRRARKPVVYCAVLMVDVLKGMENVTAAHIDQRYMLHASSCRA